MSRDQLIAEARAAGQAARHNLRFIQNNPDKVDQSKLPDMEEYLRMLIRFEAYEKKNARRLGRTSLRSRLKFLLLSIITQKLTSRNTIKEELSKCRQKNGYAISVDAQQNN